MQKVQCSQSFPMIADKCIQTITEKVQDKYPNIDDKESHGVYAFKLNGGEYVINRQIPNCQIWLSSPVSGASHYDYVNGRFFDKENNIGLSELLAKEIGI